MLGIMTNIAWPLMRRFGTGASSFGAGFGLSTEQIATLEAAAIVLVGVVIDLMNSAMERRVTVKPEPKARKPRTPKAAE